MVSLGVSVSLRVSGDGAVKPGVEKRMFTWGTGLSSVVDILRMEEMVLNRSASCIK